MKRLLLSTIAAFAMSTSSSAGEPVVGLNIVLEMNGVMIASGNTDEDGSVSFLLPRDGLYDLSATNWQNFTEADRPHFTSIVTTDDGLWVSSCLCKSDVYVTFRSFRWDQAAIVRIEYSNEDLEHSRR
ncbi:hypothetical protein [Hyphobacterium sp.]|uniref:hypothetical protein n=1 Tax=Hyphobacterium sp. TaxID=2004662 RepID=UPI003BA8622B